MSSLFAYEETYSPESYDFKSLYIPNLPDDLMLLGSRVQNDAELQYLFEVQFPLGVVKRVDIATRPHRNGGNVKCAFVHFEKWHPFSNQLRDILVKNTEFRLHGTNPYTSFYSATNRGFNRYITLKINNAPIAEVSPLDADAMNIHQLVDNYKRLEKQLCEKNAKIAEMNETIVTKDLKIDELHRMLVNYIEIAEKYLILSAGKDCNSIETSGRSMTLDDISQA
jgi:hypothetical protein